MFRKCKQHNWMSSNSKICDQPNNDHIRSSQSSEFDKGNDTPLYLRINESFHGSENIKRTRDIIYRSKKYI